MWMAVCLGVAGAVMWFAERRRPRRDFEAVNRWRRRAVALSLIQVSVAYVGGTLLDPVFQGIRPGSAAWMGPGWGVVYGYLGVTFLWYWWHRARHQIPLLWRLLHQVHHSPTRLELLTTYYKHPLESSTNVVLGGLALYAVLGLTPLQAAGVTVLCGLAEFFYHWNVRTPRWVGWFVQRPESHCVHHEAGRHASNYGDLPLWDWLFGTLNNPRHDQVRCGFGDDEQRLAEMLRGREVA